MKLKKTMIILAAVCIFIFTGIFTEKTAAAAATQMIRVGLTQNFKDKSSLTISNTMLTCGYWSQEKNQFWGCEVFTSKNGFTFTPYTTTCFVSDISFSSWQKANDAVKKFTDAGLKAYPAILHENYWKIYVAGDGEDCKRAAQLGLANFSSSTVTMRYRMLVTGDFGAFLIDVDDGRTYPMFGATSSNAKGDYVVTLGTKSYRGYLEIGRYGNSGVTAVNILPVEEYLYGVVSCEVSYLWHAEMLKAQAVAARSYAVAQDTIGPLAHVSSGGYKLEDTTVSQAYGGYLTERASTTKAVNDTANQKLYYRGSVIKAYYFSTSGGSTEDAQAVWNVPIPYFRRTADIEELSPAKAPWIVELKSSEINKMLKAAGYQELGNITRVTAEIKTESGRVYSLYLKGSDTLRLQKSNISSVLDLPSTKFKVISYGDVPDKVSVISADKNDTVQISNSYILSKTDTAAKKASAIEQYVVMGAENLENYPRRAPLTGGTYYFAGMGYGHGIGMSQSGAACLAENGYNYKQILQYYYPGVEVR